jgi:hypothetical protein
MNLRSTGPEADARATFRNSTLLLFAGKLVVATDEVVVSAFGPTICVGLREKERDAPRPAELFPCDCIHVSGDPCRR